MFFRIPASEYDVDGIHAQSTMTWRNLISAHAPLTYILEIDGRRFEHLKGQVPYFIYVPEINACIFSTDDPGDGPRIHIVKRKPYEHILIEDRFIAFGGSTGLTDRFRDSALLVSESRLVIAHVILDKCYAATIDLGTHKIVEFTNRELTAQEQSKGTYLPLVRQ